MRFKPVTVHLRPHVVWFEWRRRFADLPRHRKANDSAGKGVGSAGLQRWDGVADGIRTRNSQNHNLGLYH